MAPFSKTPNPGNEYKAWLVPTSRATISSSDPKVLVFGNSDAKTDNFKAPNEGGVTQGSCQPSSSLSVNVSGTNVVSYVPKGCLVMRNDRRRGGQRRGEQHHQPLIPTASVVNSCASNPITGQTVCTANNTDVYVLKGTAFDPGVSPNPLTSAGSRIQFLLRWRCTNCGVAMDAAHNKAVIGLSTSAGPGFQFRTSPPRRSSRPSRR